MYRVPGGASCDVAFFIVAETRVLTILAIQLSQPNAS